MASVFLFVFFLLSHLPLLHSTEECPPFACGKLRMIGFPFTNSSHPECGVFPLVCHHSKSRIQLGDVGTTYPVLSISQDNTLRIIDEELSERLKSHSCESFTNLTFPNSSFFSFEIVPNQTFFKCNRALNVSPPPYFKTRTCSDSDIYYSTPNQSCPDAFSGCSIIQLPKKWGPGPGPPPNSDDPFSLVTPEFNLKVHVSGECYDCHDEGGQCKVNAGKFYCDGVEKGIDIEHEKKKINPWKIALGVLCPVFFILFVFLIFLWRKRRGSFPNMLAKRTYSAPSSRSDVEAGGVYFGVPVYSYSELEEATNNFDVKRDVGEGRFGTVYYGKLRDGREVAIKRLHEHNYKRVAQFMNEVEVLTRLRHKNLVSLYGCTSRCSRELLLVHEYIPNGTIADHIHGDRATTGSLPWPTRMSIAIETANALAYLHASEIIHRDVKTNSILLDHNFSVKVAGFGLSRLFPFNVTHVSTAPQGTPGYIDPEYLQCYQLTTKSDVYSFGVVLIELISSLPAVDLARHDINLTTLALKRIERSEYQELIDSRLGFESDKEVQRMTISVAQLAFRCIQHDKELRPSMDEVLEVLKKIQSGNEASEDRGKAIDDDGILNIKPPTLRPSDEFGLLKTTPLPPSPTSVTDNWTSISTAPNISS